MAAVDKIYGNEKQYDEFYNWCLKNNPNITQYFYEKNYKDSNLSQAITNFPVNIDEWLYENCNIDWVIREIRFQYNLSEFDEFPNMGENE